MSFTVDFEWAVDEAGYTWVPEEPADESDEKSAFGEILSALYGKPIRPARIVRRGGKLRPNRPFERVNGLFLPFSKSATTAEGLVEFINRHGPMTREGNEASGEDAIIGIGHAQSISEFLRNYRLDRHSCFATFGEQGLGWSRVDIGLAFNLRTGQPQMKLKPSSLVNALWFEIAASLTGDAPLRACRHCGEWFQTGPGTTRRLDATFCSNDHRVAFNSLKRRRRDRVS